MERYKWLRNNMRYIIEQATGKEFNNSVDGLISCYGDKIYSYKKTFENNGISFKHGSAIYLLTYISPFSDEVRQTRNGWVDPLNWIIKNKDRFLPILEEIKEDKS